MTVTPTSTALAQPIRRVDAAAAVLRYAPYVRVSAVMGREDAHFISPDLQLASIRRHVQSLAAAAGKRPVEVAIYVDLDESGRSMNRPDLNRALDDTRAGGLDVLGVYDLSRWSRDTTEGLAELVAVEALGAGVASTHEVVDLSTPEGYFNTTIAFAVHKLRSDTTSRGWRHALRYRAENRGQHNGPPPTGYRRDAAPDGRLTKRGRAVTRGPIVPDPKTAPLILEAFERFDRGESAYGINIAMRDRGLAWTHRTLRKTLANRVYVGDVKNNGQWFPGSHEPIVPRALFDRVQKRLERERRAPVAATEPRHALHGGLITCVYCGRALIFFAGQRGPDSAYYSDRNGAMDAGCPGVGAPRVADVEAAVLAALLERAALLRSDAAARVAARSRRNRARVDVAALRREIDETEAALGRLAAQQARGQVVGGQRAYEAAAGTLAADLDRLHRELADAEVVAVAPPAVETARACDQLRELWPQMTHDERRRALVAVGLERVEVRRRTSRREPTADTLALVWRF